MWVTLWVGWPNSTGNSLFSTPVKPTTFHLGIQRANSGNNHTGAYKCRRITSQVTLLLCRRGFDGV